MTEIGEGGFIELPLTMLVLARLLHDHNLLSVVVLRLLGVVDDEFVADNRLGDL